MSITRRRTTRRRALFTLADSSSGPQQGSPFAAYLKTLESADSFSKVLSIALRSELTYFRRPMDVLHYRKVAKKVSEFLEEFVQPLMKDDIGKYPYTEGLMPIDNLKLTYKFLTNMQYFSTTGKFHIRDPFQLNALIPEEQNNVLVGLYLRMPPELESLPEVGAFPKGAIPFIRMAYKIVRENRLYTGEFREKWKWNLKVPPKHPLIIGMKNGEAGRLALEVRHS